jgi:hypothetical protein
MMQNTAYRLAEYKIIENEHGDLWWETHIGFGSLKSGKCFINGDILFIKPSNSAGPGFLKGEFLDHLNKLPKWEKTKFYCTSFKIYECKSGKTQSLFEGRDSRLQKETILKKNASTLKEVTTNKYKSVKADGSGDLSYKIYRYEIIERNKGQLFWKSYGGLNSLKEGRCCINGSILFLEHGLAEQSGFKKRKFLQKLIQLPDWERTKYFCTSYAIYYSNTGVLCRGLRQDKDLKPEKDTKYDAVSHKTYRTGIKYKPILLEKIFPKDKLKTFFIVCKIKVLLILDLLVGCLKVLHKSTRVLVGKLTQSRG